MSPSPPLSGGGGRCLYAIVQLQVFMKASIGLVVAAVYTPFMLGNFAVELRACCMSTLWD